MRAENSALICWKLYSAYRYLEILDSYVSLYIREERKTQSPSSMEVVTKKLKNEKLSAPKFVSSARKTFVDSKANLNRVLACHTRPYLTLSGSEALPNLLQS